MSDSLKKIKEQASNPDLILTPHINAWLTTNGESEYSPSTVARVADILAAKPRNRSGSFSASSAGYCERRQMYGYLGVPEVQILPVLQSLFNDGKWRHLRWQALLLDAGLLTDIEVAVPMPEYNSKGSMDGQGFTGDLPLRDEWKNKKFGFELKGVHPSPFATLKKNGFPSSKHVKQMQRYMLASGLDLFVYIAEDKASHEWLEFVVEYDEVRAKKSWSELNSLNAALASQTLPDRLPICQQIKDGNSGKPTLKKGFMSDTKYTFEQCPFGKTKTRSTCFKLETWEDTVEYVAGKE